MHEPELSEVLAELRELRAEVATLRAQARVPAPSPSPRSTDFGPRLDSTASDGGSDGVSRRQALRTAGLVAAGALAGGAALVANAAPAAATAPTTFNSDGLNPAVTAVGSQGMEAIFATSDGSGPTISAIGSQGFEALILYSGANTGNTLFAETSGTGAVAIRAQANGGDNAVAIRGTSQSGRGVQGDSTNGPGVIGGSTLHSGVIGASSSGYGGQFASTSGIGLQATGPIAITAEGTYSAMKIGPTAFTPPATSSHAYTAGEITQGPGGVLWYCVTSGTPGTWRTLSAPTAAGAFYALAPSRIYDSRLNSYPQPGPLGSLQNRTLSVANSYDTNGTPTTTNFVPAGATAVFANVTIVDTVGAGYLAINPGGNTTPNSSTINWSANGQILANGIALTLNTNREITVVNGSAGSTHFIIDITGYWM